jgi:hypothetical protein
MFLYLKSFYITVFLLSRALNKVFGSKLVPWELTILNWLDSQGPPHDFEDVTSNQGMEPFQSVSELMHSEDEDMVRHAMEAALSQYNSIDSYMSQDAPVLDSTSGFNDWLPGDNQLCRVLS